MSSAWSMAKDSKCPMYILAITGDKGEPMVAPVICHMTSLPIGSIGCQASTGTLFVVIGWFNYLVCCPLLILPQPPAWLRQLVFASTSTMRLESLSSVTLILSTK